MTLAAEPRSRQPLWRRLGASRRLGVPTGLFALAFALRMLPWATVLGPGGAHFTGHDAYYHMRRVVYGLANFPDWLDFDPYLNFPHGARPIWTPVFDWLSTLFVLPFHAVAGLPGAEWAAATIPALLGAATVVVVYLAGRELFDRQIGAIAAVLLSLTAVHVWYSSLGFFDHHVAVAFVAAGMLWAAIRWVQAPSTRSSLLLSGSQAAALLLWPGMLLHLALVELGVLLAALRDTPAGAERMRQRALGHALAFLLVAPLCLGQSWPQWGDYAPTVLSRFQPWLFAALSAHAAAAAVLWQRQAASSVAVRAAGLLGLGLAVAAVSVLLMPELFESANDAWRWLGKTERFQSRVKESRGILVSSDGLSVRLLLRNLSVFGLLLPVSLAALAWKSRRRSDWDARALLALFSAGLFVATFQQRRFGTCAALGVALVSAWAIHEVWRSAVSRSGGRAWLAGPAVVLATTLALAPTLRPRLEALRHTIERVRGQPLGLDPYQSSKRQLLDAGRWLRDNAGHDGDLTQLSRIPAYGLMAPWHLGHRLLYTSRLPTIVSNFGDDLGEQNFTLHRLYMRSAEPQAAARLDQLRARFVVVESLNQAAQDLLGPLTVLRLLTDTPLRDLGFHRLRYSTPVSPGRPNVRSYRVFERVAGARVVGRAQPGAPVTARMRVHAGRQGVPLVHATTADAAGWYRLRLAQASVDAVRDGGWQLESRAQSAPLALPLQDVLEGTPIAGPDLR